MQLSAYYFRAHMYTLVPHQVREDMAWMADVGTNAVCLAVLEQDFHAGRENIEIIAKEADRFGMEVFAVPSRWGGLVAGSPKVPSLFSVLHPETWMLQADGTPYTSSVCGVHSSVHHPATFDFFAEKVTSLLSELPFKGIIWDEVKILNKEDHSPAALAVRPEQAGVEWDNDQSARFFGRVNAVAREVNSGVRLSLFVYSHRFGAAEKRYAQIDPLDDFGCDGRPWGLDDDGVPDGGEGKVLLGPGQTFVAEARKNGKNGLILIENHNLRKQDNALMDRRLPEVLALGAGHVMYYYYPRNLQDPDDDMQILGKHLKRR
jgi:hypothetical protein